MDLDHPIIPDTVRESAAFVMEYASDVKIDYEAMKTLAPKIQERFERGFDSVEDAFGSTDNLDDDINLIYFETAANFCFWSQHPENKWKINGTGGWYGLKTAFNNALAHGEKVYDARFMSQLTLQQAAAIFKGDNESRIPLLEQRVNNIIEAANFLLKHHDGSAHNFLRSCDFDAPTITREITKACASYRDGAWYQGRWVWILKRAQILPNDLAQLSQKYTQFSIKNTDQLTIFADYRLPQILRHYGVLAYSEKLASLIDTKHLLPSGSREEIEIRMGTILACDKLAEHCSMSVADTDVSLWLISQDMRDNPSLKPHHLTISHYY